MEFRHTSVLLEETLQGLDLKPGSVYVDGTLGGGGHAAAACERLGPGGTLVGIDTDTDALRAAEENLRFCPGRKFFVKDNYGNVKDVLQRLDIPHIDGALLDLGVSSFQLDNPHRGFSYMQNAPLDMRMDQSGGITAEDVVNEYDENELRRVIRDYGEERWASRIAGFIVKQRRERRIRTTEELVEIIKAAVPASARREGPHPAKRTFQAIRIEVNDELRQLEKAVRAMIDVLAPGGRLAIITFHSLEDRIVKEIFQKEENPCTCPPDLPVCVCGKKPRLLRVNRKPITASARELSENPRSRSAKLRIAQRL